jgi:hypothetical protein
VIAAVIRLNGNSKMRPVFLCLILTLWNSNCSADTITLVDGKTVSGTVTNFGAEGFSVTLVDGATQRIAANAVRSIKFVRQTNAAKQKPKTQAVASKVLTPSGAIAKSKSLGLHEDMNWRKSKIANEWIAQLRCFNGASGKNLTSKQVLRNSGLSNTNNELNVQLLGPSRRKLSSVQIEAEIYNSNYSADTVKLGQRLIRSLFPDCPDSVLAAFQNGQSYKSGQWTVSRSNHNAGYDVKLVRTIGG